MRNEKVPHFLIFQYFSSGGNKMPNVEVRCSVSNCYFHKKGNVCGAEKIMIDTDWKSNNDTEFASDFDFSKERAANSHDTCCKTFKPKEAEKK